MDRRLEQAKLAKKEEELARKKDIVAQLKDAQLEIEMNILHSLISKDIVLFAYNYYRSILCMHASEELDLETLEFYCTLPYEVEDWDLPSNIDIMDRYLPLEYNHNILLGAYTVRDLLGCARGKILGISDCSEDFFDNHCKIVSYNELVGEFEAEMALEEKADALQSQIKMIWGCHCRCCNS